jgi:hypothetical protein
MGIRLATERYIIGKLQDANFVNTIQKSQTNKLIKQFGRENDDATAMTLFEQVLLMTPENIHMNSFMFEPILDMAPLHLHELYNAVMSLD